MDQSTSRELQHVGLPTACAVVYAQIMGVAPDAKDPPEMQSVLNQVAQALSNLVPIYATNEKSGLPIAIEPYELLTGGFVRGAHAFRRKDGAEKDKLTVQRRDMYNAISVLKSAHITFSRPTIG